MSSSNTVQSVYDNHFTSAFSCDLEGTTKDHDETCVLQVHNMTGDVQDVYHGKEGAVELFTGLLEDIKAGGDSNNVEATMVDISEKDKTWFVTWKNSTPSVSFFSSFVKLNDEFKIVKHVSVIKMVDA